MNKQDIFNKVAVHLFDQSKRATANDGEYCQYRGKDNTKCAIGALIPDEMYDEKMEGGSVYVLFRRFPAMEEFFSVENTQFLRELQYVHDNRGSWYTNEMMRGALRAVGEAYEVDTSIVDTLHFRSTR